MNQPATLCSQHAAAWAVIAGCLPVAFGCWQSKGGKLTKQNLLGCKGPECLPAMKDTMGFVVFDLVMNSAASSSAVPPISPIMMIPSVCNFNVRARHWLAAPNN